MFKTILVPVDLSEVAVSEKAIETACALAEVSGGAMRLVNVQTLLPSTFMDYVPADFDAQQRTKAELQMRLITEKVPLARERVTSRVRVGGIYPEILAEADHWGADLIVIGSHRPGMATYLIGSNATRLVRHATCSVLVVR